MVPLLPRRAARTVAPGVTGSIPVGRPTNPPACDPGSGSALVWGRFGAKARKSPFRERPSGSWVRSPRKLTREFAYPEMQSCPGPPFSSRSGGPESACSAEMIATWSRSLRAPGQSQVSGTSRTPQRIRARLAPGSSDAIGHGPPRNATPASACAAARAPEPRGVRRGSPLVCETNRSTAKPSSARKARRMELTPPGLRLAKSSAVKSARDSRRHTLTSRKERLSGTVRLSEIVRLRVGCSEGRA